MSRFGNLSAGDRQALIRKAGELALQHFVAGFNCAESVLYGIIMAFDLQGGDEVMRVATPFGGGIGMAGSVCGALSGGVVGLGLVFGRTVLDAEQKKVAYAHAERLWRQFVERTSGEDCRTINTLGFDHPDHRSFCGRFVTIGAELAAGELLEG